MDSMRSKGRMRMPHMNEASAVIGIVLILIVLVSLAAIIRPGAGGITGFETADAKTKITTKEINGFDIRASDADSIDSLKGKPIPYYLNENPEEDTKPSGYYIPGDDNHYMTATFGDGRQNIFIGYDGVATSTQYIVPAGSSIDFKDNQIIRTTNGKPEVIGTVDPAQKKSYSVVQVSEPGKTETKPMTIPYEAQINSIWVTTDGVVISKEDEKYTLEGTGYDQNSKRFQIDGDSSKNANIGEYNDHLADPAKDPDGVQIYSSSDSMTDTKPIGTYHILDTKGSATVLNPAATGLEPTVTLTDPNGKELWRGRGNLNAATGTVTTKKKNKEGVEYDATVARQWKDEDGTVHFSDDWMHTQSGKDIATITYNYAGNTQTITHTDYKEANVGGYTGSEYTRITYPVNDFHALEYDFQVYDTKYNGNEYLITQSKYKYEYQDASGKPCGPNNKECSGPQDANKIIVKDPYNAEVDPKTCSGGPCKEALDLKDDIEGGSALQSGLSGARFGQTLSSLTGWTPDWNLDTVFGPGTFFGDLVDMLQFEQFAADSICSHYVDSPPDGTLPIQTPDGMIQEAIHAEGFRSQAMESVDESGKKVVEYLYKFTYFAINPRDSGKNMQFFVNAYTPEGIEVPLQRSKLLAPGESLSRMNRNAKANYSEKYLVKVCIILSSPLKRAGDNKKIDKVCRSILPYEGLVVPPAQAAGEGGEAGAGGEAGVPENEKEVDYSF